MFKNNFFIKTCLVFMSMTGFAYSKTVYVILEDEVYAEGTLKETFDRGHRMEGDGTTLDIRAADELTAKLNKRCQENYLGHPSKLICITLDRFAKKDWLDDGLPWLTFYKHSKGKMYCRTDDSKLSFWDNTLLGNKTGGRSFTDCEYRINNPVGTGLPPLANH